LPPESSNSPCVGLGPVGGGVWSLRERTRESAQALSPVCAHAAVLLVLSVLFTTGCGYRVVGRASTLPADIRTVAVPAFENQTVTYRIEQRLTEAVVRSFLTRTKYRVVADPQAADATVHGQIAALDAGAVVFDAATGRATAVLVTIRLSVRLEDRTGKVLYRNNNFVFRQPYEISAASQPATPNTPLAATGGFTSTDIAAFFQEEGPTLDRMASDFADRLVSDILENF
jgi:outer membrane lipopolysaccharide assembly protein LptE/RlpB